MKTTIEIPDELARQAAVIAADRGVPIDELVGAAIRSHLSREETPEPAWRKYFGALAHLKDENARIMKVIEEEFGQVNPNEWK